MVIQHVIHHESELPMKPFRLVLSTLLLLATGLASAEPYSQATFDRLIREGKPALVQVHADWCPTCRAQAPVIDALLREQAYRGITPLKVDFDRQKDVLKTLHVSRQSTLIVFNNGKEVGRALGVTSRSGIARLLDKAR